jgi:hypothetical protein
MRSVPLLLRSCAVTVLALAVAGCFGSRRASDGPMSEEERARRAALTVLDGQELDAAIASGATLAQILSTRVASIRELRNSGLGTTCPVFVLRGNSSIQQVTEPDYYVDASRANDSCVLLALSAAEVRSIEVYASGAAPAGLPMRARTGGAIVLRRRMR